RALAFHATADTIVPAAQSANAQKVLSTLGATLETCVSCHAAYRQEIVSQARWDQLTSDQK
ncbi:MAG TPA: hypothetical protein VFS55_02495, partial [Dokdonella sp.]|nr:hypothetical protein [Dokdonella sp.]